MKIFRVKIPDAGHEICAIFAGEVTTPPATDRCSSLPVTVLKPSLMYARGQPGTFISATTIPTETVSDIVLNISSQNWEEFWFLSLATVSMGGCKHRG